MTTASTDSTGSAGSAAVDAPTIKVLGICGSLREKSYNRMLLRAAQEELPAGMTLAPGDLVILGVPANAPRARAGQRVRIDIEGVGRLENTLIEEAA